MRLNGVEYSRSGKELIPPSVSGSVVTVDDISDHEVAGGFLVKEN